jgi:aryl-alcohol dehydrogenase-like predicted oxidoreductase
MALGTWGLSGDAYGPVGVESQERVLRRALEMGVTLIETSDAYGAGRMEQLVGAAVADRDDVVVVTKGGTDRKTSPPRKRFDRAYLRDSVERSLRRLGKTPIDVFLLHNPSEVVFGDREAVDTMLEMKKEGKIAHWGASVGDVVTGRVALRSGAEVIEVAYNLFHSSDLHRLAGDLMVTGAGVLARSTLAHGLLVGHWSAQKDFPEGDHRASRWTKPELERRLEQLAAVRFLVHGDVMTLRAAAVRFVLANSMVSSAVLGPRTVDQIEELVREVGGGPVYMREADLARLPHALDAVGIDI